MDAIITIKNYRCFSDSAFARFKVKDGFTSFLGINNAGKSSVLKFFFEFRSIFQMLHDEGRWASFLNATRNSFSLAPTVRDVNELFHKFNDRDLTVSIEPLNDGGGKGDELIIRVFSVHE